MKIIPLYDKVGYYGFFFASIDEFNNYASQIDWDFSDAFVEISSCEIIRITQKGRNKISRDELNKYLNPPMPFWIKDDFNYSCAINKRFADIKPKTAEVITTMNCCFRCLQCSYREPKEKIGVWNKIVPNVSNKYNMSIEHVEAVVDRLYKAGIENIVFTGGGEPLFNSQVTLMGMKHAKDRDINVGLYTNGYFLNEQVIEKIKTINPLFIRISIYGMDSNSFRRYVNIEENGFYHIINNVKKLLSVKNKGELNSKIILSFLVHPELYPDISYVDHFFEDYFSMDELKAFAYIRFTPAVDYFHNEQHDRVFFDTFFQRVTKNAERLKNVVPLIVYTHRINDLYIKGTFSECLGSGFYTEIAPNGDVYLCCERIMDDDYLIGNIIDDSLEDIFYSEKRLNLIRQINVHKCQMCPPLCKPHEINKQLAQLAEISTQQLQQWRTDLLEISKKSGIFGGNMNDFES